MYLGIDVGGTNLKAGIIDANNILIKKMTQETPASIEPAEFAVLLVQIIKDILIEFPTIKTIGIGFPGIINSSGNIVVSPNFPKWLNYPLLPEITRHFRRPIAMENDANIAGVAELYEGAGRYMRDFIYVSLGTGIGAAIIINGSLYRGMTGNAGELGHMIIDAMKKNKQGSYMFQTGTVEQYSGKEAIIELTNRTAREMGITSSSEKFSGVIEIEKAAAEGCVAADIAMKMTGDYIACGIISAMNLLDIHNVVLGGGIAKSNIIFKTIQEAIAKRALPHIAHSFTLQRAIYMEDTGIMGAAIYGKHQTGNI